MTPAKRPLSHRSPSPTPECSSLSPAMLPVELEERLTQKMCIAVSSPNVAEEADDHYWRQALKQRARVCGHVSSAGYDIEVIDSDALRRAVSQVKWPTPNPLGSTAVDLIHGPAAASTARPSLSTSASLPVQLTHRSPYQGRPEFLR